MKKKKLFIFSYISTFIFAFANLKPMNQYYTNEKTPLLNKKTNSLKEDTQYFYNIEEMVSHIQDYVSQNDCSTIIKFFKKQKNELIKTAIRFEYLQQKGNLIDSINIGPVFYQLKKAQKNGWLNFATLFQNNKKLTSILDSILKLVEPICKRKIEALYLCDNHLKNIPESLSCLINLKKLALHNNDLKELPESILNLKNLDCLHIDAKLLKQSPKKVAQILEKLIRQSPHLKINLERRTICLSTNLCLWNPK